MSQHRNINVQMDDGEKRVTYGDRYLSIGLCLCKMDEFAVVMTIRDKRMKVLYKSESLTECQNYMDDWLERAHRLVGTDN